MTESHDRTTTVAHMVFVAMRRAALGPVRAAARSSRDILAGEAERAMDGVLEGPLPEAVARSLAEHQVIERLTSQFVEATVADGEHTDQIEQLIEQVLQSGTLERWVARDGGRLVEPIAAQVLQSEAFRKAIFEIVASDELRRALSQQTVGFGAEVAAGARARCARTDDAAEARVHRALRRPASLAARASGGLVARGVALVVDLVVAQMTFLVGAASLALVWSLVGTLTSSGALEWGIAGGGWLIVAGAYFIAFWASAGQTPGMRLMRLRVVTGGGAPLSFARSSVRFVGLLLAILPLLAGFLPALVDGRRRALQDFIAGTVVLHDEDGGIGAVYLGGGAGGSGAPILSPPVADTSMASSDNGAPRTAPFRTVWRNVDGVRVHALAAGTGAPVLLVHGFGVSGSYMLPLARLLTNAFTAYVPDLPGHGRSGRPRGPWRFEEQARALGAWIDAVDLRAPIVVANSFGCQIVTQLAVNRPGLLGPMVLIGPTVDPARRAARHQLFGVLRDSRHEPLSLFGLAARDAAGRDIGPLVTTARAALADRIEDRLPAIEQPTVVVHGEDDGFLGKEWAERVAALLPRGRLVLVPSEPHAVHYTRPDLIAEIVGELAAVAT